MKLTKKRLESLALGSCIFGLVACTANLEGGGVDTQGSGGLGQSGGLPGTGGDAPGSGGSPTSVPTDPDELAEACNARSGQLTLGLTKLRRMTRRQLDQTVLDLVGMNSSPGQALAPDEKIGPFDNNAITPITELLVEQHREIALAVALEALPRRGDITGCDLDTEGSACASSFIDSFGKKAFRRPVSEEEHLDLLALYELGASGSSPENGFRLLLEAFLQSPSFLYHVDVPQSGLATAVAEPVDAFGLASRLSYFLWNTMPDEELFARAEDGSLLSASGIDAQVARMLADDRAADTIGLFHRQWLKVEGIETKSKDEAVYPGFTPEVATAMTREFTRFSAYVIQSGDGLLNTLLTANFSFPELEVLPYYGLQAPAGFGSGDRLEIPHPRAGILTQPAVMAKLSHANQTSPVHRGTLIRENLLCQHMQPPPPGVSTALPAVTPATTTRQRIEQHTASAACSGCHALIDPLGMAFEHYDGVGAYRTTDGSGAVDAKGVFVETRADLQGEFQDAVDLAAQLAQATEVQDCVSNQWFRFALGRAESLDDACVLVDLHRDFTASGANINELLHLIAMSDAFRNVRSTTGE